MGNKNSLFCLENNFSKNKIVHSDEQLRYAVCHMKGRLWTTKVGESLWKTPAFIWMVFLKTITIFLAFSMVMEVKIIQNQVLKLHSTFKDISQSNSTWIWISNKVSMSKHWSKLSIKWTSLCRVSQVANKLIPSSEPTLQTIIDMTWSLKILQDALRMYVL